MHKRMTITLDEAVYEGLYRTIGKRRMSQFIEDLLRPMYWIRRWMRVTAPWPRMLSARARYRNGATP